MSISQNRLAREISVSPRRINEICLRKRAVSAETAILLSRFFGNDAHFWLGLQNDYDLEEARKRLSAT